jgi:hypothetical protein
MSYRTSFKKAHNTSSKAAIKTKVIFDGQNHLIGDGKYQIKILLFELMDRFEN